MQSSEASPRSPQEENAPAAATAWYNQSIRRAIFPPIIGLTLLAVLLLWQVRSLLSAARWEDHSDHVIAQADQSLKLLLDMETGERGYLVGGDTRFLKPYQDASRNITRELDALANQVTDNPAQVTRVLNLRAGYKAWLSIAQHEMALRASNSPALVSTFNTAQGKKRMDDLRQQFAAFVEAEKKLRKQRADDTHRQTHQTIWGGGLITLLLGALLAATTHRHMRGLSTQFQSLLSAELQAREYLGATLTSIGDAVLVTDARGKVTRINPICERLTGWTAAEAEGADSTKIFDILNEATRQTVESPVERIIREGVIVGLANHTILRRRDGTEIPIDDSGAPIRDADGNLVGVVLVFRDISERHAAEKALRESEEFLRRVLESSPDCIATLDLAGCVIALNDQGQVLLEVENFADIRGTDWRTLWPEEAQAAVNVALDAARAGTRGRFQGFSRSRKGMARWWDVAVAPILGKNGEAEQILCIARDITEAKRAEEAQARLHQRERTIASQLQEALIPSVPESVPGLSLAMAYHPALGEADVGGDFSDCFEVDRYCTALVVADLAGKGLAAAAQVATVRNMLRYALYQNPSLAQAMIRLNDVLVDNALLLGFATLFVGVYDQGKRTLTYVNCGQEPGLLRRAATGEIEQLTTTGPVLGGFAGAVYTETSIPMHPGDALALFTDGLSEAGPDRRTLLGIDGVAGLLGEANDPEITAKSLVAHLVSGVNRFSQGRVADDVCLLVAVVESNNAL